MDYSVHLNREMCIGRSGVIVAEYPQAVEAGLKVLREGGNAVDAAIATAAVLNVRGPGSSGLGGDAFMLIYDAKTKRVTGINGSGRVPRAASVDYYKRQGATHMPEEGIHSVSVPGAVDAYIAALELFGTMPLSTLLRPAIEYAEDGIVMKADHRRALFEDEKLRRYPSSAAIYCRDGVLSKRVGVLVNKDLGRSLRLIAEGGRDVFYKGEIAEAIVACSEANGGLFTMQDFETHSSDVYEPIHTTYRGYTIYETTLPSQGHIVLEELNILEGYDVASMGFGLADHIHHMVEAKKLAFSDRLAYSGDPEFEDVPLEKMLSKDFARDRRHILDPHKASAVVTPGNIHREGDTTSFSIADKYGNAVSFIISLSSYLGSGLVADGTGILLNDRAGHAQGFVLEEGHPNQLEPGKRTMHTLNTFLVCNGDELFFLGNTPGGDLQPQLNFQTIVNVIDFDMSPQEALEAPAWISFPGASPPDRHQPFVLRLDSRFETQDEEIRELKKRGHTIAFGDYFGDRKIIMKDPDSGILLGGSESHAGCL